MMEKIKILRAGASIDPKRWADRGKYFLADKKFKDASRRFAPQWSSSII